MLTHFLAHLVLQSLRPATWSPLESSSPHATEILQLGEQERPKRGELAKGKAGKRIHASASNSIPYFDREAAMGEHTNTKMRRGIECKDARHQATRRPRQQVRSVERCDDVQS